MNRSGYSAPSQPHLAGYLVIVNRTRLLLKLGQVDRLNDAREFQDAKDNFHRFDVVSPGA